MNQKETILIVDDTLTNIDILVKLLDQYDLIVATSGDEALNILNDGEQIDLILLDIMMPQMDGFEVCSIIKSTSNISEIPIIFLTAKFDDASIQKGFEHGAVDYIIKPFRPIELLARIKTHLKIVNHEKTLVENNKNIAIAELIHNIAHQWRQPLSVISTASSAIILEKEMHMLKDDSLIDYCEKIIDSTEYLSTIINNISHIINDNDTSDKINVKKLFDENFILFLGYTKENISNINLSIPHTLSFNGNKNKLIQVLLSIFANSKEAIGEDFKNKLAMSVIAKSKKNICKISISDNSGGIDDTIINRVFEPYFTTKYKSQGRGLGLYLSKKMIEELFNGTISVTNIEYTNNNILQKGVRFDIEIPL